MRVAINVEQLLYRSPGGVGRYTGQLAALLPAVVPGTEVLAFTARHPRSDVMAAAARAGIGAGRPGAEVTVLPLPRAALYEAWHSAGVLGPCRLSRALAGADVVHAPSLAVPPREGRPLVVTVHDAAPVLFPEAFPRRGLRFHLKGLAAAARRADAVITVSHAAADELAAHTAIDPARIRVVPNGVQPPPPDPPAREAALARWGLGAEPFVLWVGSLEPRKNVGTLVAAMARLRRGGRGARLVLAGFEGWLHEGLVDPADVASLGDSLVRTGPVNEGELWALYGAAAVVAVPSRHEGFGYPVVEAMSQGTAVVASDIAPLREVAGGAAVLVDPGDVEAWAGAVEGLLADEGARRAAGAAGRERAARFTAAVSVAGTAAVYAEVAGGAGPAAGSGGGRPLNR